MPEIQRVPTWKRVTEIVLGVLVLNALLGLCLFAYDYANGRVRISTAQAASKTAATIEVAKPKPVYEWVARNPETFVAQPNGAAIFGCEDCSGEHFRFRVVSKAPVTVIAFSVPKDKASAAGEYMIAAVKAGTCRRDGVLDATMQCDLQPGAWVVTALDLRNEPTAVSSLTAGAMAYLGNKGPMNEMLARNDVTGTIYDYKCVRNCSAEK